MVHLNSLIDVGIYAKYLQMLERACDTRSKEVGVGEVLWLITGRCNLKCDYCYLGDTYRNFELPEKDKHGSRDSSASWVCRWCSSAAASPYYIRSSTPS
jgi:sulfatase maturation enzyme AslB (radical SAM superfamily)